jgi:hypothetical protein
MAQLHIPGHDPSFRPFERLKVTAGIDECRNRAAADVHSDFAKQGRTLI